ncbi:hypothetical protein AVEN_29340-1 [Araneus ventricosus]|uniref:Uncharacterized protein n=1 Tax=Araneus ventricosus TaxID=182803 RepID=A0A4Y2IY70_ARAVE|nr:hypothetical protein AVEN_29340-1 [Araneus ventricosus]
MREVSRVVNVPHSIVWRVLRDEELHPYHVQKVQALIPADYAPRVEFARWFLQQLAAQPNFSAHVLFTDDSTFTREGISNTHNLHVFFRAVSVILPHMLSIKLFSTSSIRLVFYSFM